MALVTASLTAVFTSPSSSRVGSNCAAKDAAALRAKPSLADREGKTRLTWLMYLMVRMAMRHSFPGWVRWG